MDWREFVASIISDVLSWPVFVLVVVLLFRKPLRELIGRIRSFEGLGQKLTFGDQLAQTEESVDSAVESVEVTPGTTPELEPPSDSSPWDDLALQAETNPSFVVVTSWERLSNALDDLLGASRSPDSISMSAHDRRRRSQTSWLNDLVKQGVLSPEFVRAAFELRGLRNRVAHGQHNPTPGEATTFVESAQELARAAHLLAQRATRSDPAP